MPKKVPSYCRHKASGKAVVRIHGKDHYLGDYSSPESHEAYERLIATWRSSTLRNQARTEEILHIADPCVAINQVLTEYLNFAAS